VKPRADRPKLSEMRARVEINGAIFEIAGRTAQLIALLALHDKRVNDPTAGKVVLHFGSGQAKLEVREALPSLWLQPE
jgi:hypothetical protein